MLFGTLFLSGRTCLIPAVGLLAIASFFLLWGYWRTPVSGGTRLACVLLKLLGILALAACLLEPLWTGQRARPGANFFVILADNSQGMQIKDRGESRSRGEFLHGLLTSSKAKWQSSIE